ncbi:unnamed protein product [Ceratitis capitata]|uniref:(Mediterranean fruit fly) hypothetical protein n=1 Tax=Ceratitis capitata TaxID=7213 RepID=A0A811V617_CERCA|nr:unnamed protein product [Ceratitis capitata]
MHGVFAYVALLCSRRAFRIHFVRLPHATHSLRHIHCAFSFILVQHCQWTRFSHSNLFFFFSFDVSLGEMTVVEQQQNRNVVKQKMPARHGAQSHYALCGALPL